MAFAASQAAQLESCEACAQGYMTAAPLQPQALAPSVFLYCLSDVLQVYLVVQVRAACGVRTRKAHQPPCPRRAPTSARSLQPSALTPLALLLPRLQLLHPYAHAPLVRVLHASCQP